MNMNHVVIMSGKKPGLSIILPEEEKKIAEYLHTPEGADKFRLLLDTIAGMTDDLAGGKVVTIIGVKFNHNDKMYNYLINDENINVGDQVECPVRDTTFVTTVRTITRCAAADAPYPVADMRVAQKYTE